MGSRNVAVSDVSTKRKCAVLVSQSSEKENRSLQYLKIVFLPAFLKLKALAFSAERNSERVPGAPRLTHAVALHEELRYLVLLSSHSRRGATVLCLVVCSRVLHEKPSRAGRKIRVSVTEQITGCRKQLLRSRTARARVEHARN